MLNIAVFHLGSESSCDCNVISNHICHCGYGHKCTGNCHKPEQRVDIVLIVGHSCCVFIDVIDMACAETGERFGDIQNWCRLCILRVWLLSLGPESKVRG